MTDSKLKALEKGISPSDSDTGELWVIQRARDPLIFLVGFRANKKITDTSSGMHWPKSELKC